MTRKLPRTQMTEDVIRPVSNATHPYWRNELHHLDEYRSTDKLPSACDIAIIGAGMAGVATAYHLLNLYEGEAKPSIVLLEARQVCSGATGRNGGHSKVKAATVVAAKKAMGLKAAEEFVDFTMRVIYDMKAVVEKEKLDCEFELRRTFDVYLDEEDAKEVEKEFRKSVANGERWTRERDLVLPEHIEQVTSIKNAKLAISGPACSLWPYKFVTQLLERITDQINLQTNTPVLSVCSEKTSGVQTITTPRGTLRASKIIFATNGYTGGISPTYKDKIVPCCITASHLRPSNPISPHLSQTYNIAYAPSQVDYLNPRPDGGIVVGGGKINYVKEKNLWYNNHDDSKLLPNVDSHFGPLMQNYFRGWEYSNSKLDQLWTGIIGYTADEKPHIGAVPGQEGKQWIIAGFNGGGMSFIFTAAKGLARMVKGEVGFEGSGLPGAFEPTWKRLERKIEDPDKRT